MAKGIIYIMTTAVSGLVKIGKTGTNNYRERMRFLEANGYYNVSGLKCYFAIEIDDYDEKESLFHEIFNKHQVGNSELFALDQDLIKQLLLSFDGKVIFPENINIGTIDKIYIDKQTNYYTLSIKLFNDMTNLGHVYILKSKGNIEMTQLENQRKKDE